MSKLLTFVNTGSDIKTGATALSKHLSVIEIDNDMFWHLEFYYHNVFIDCIDLQSIRSDDKLYPLILRLAVYNDDEKYLGTVKDRIEYAYQIHIKSLTLLN